MPYTEICHHCGHAQVAYVHHLNKPLVSALRQLVDFYELHKRGANLQKDLDLTKSLFTNFQKLQYFGFVRRETALGWFPTQLGIDFIYGLVQSCTHTTTISGVVRSDIPPPENNRYLFVYEIDTTQYKQRDEYQAEKSQQTSMFTT